MQHHSEEERIPEKAALGDDLLSSSAKGVP